MSVSYTTTSTLSHGPYISSVTVDGITWPFEENYLFTAIVYSTGLAAEVPLTSKDNFTITDLTTVGDVDTYTFTNVAPLPTLVIKISIDKGGTTGLSFKAPEVSSCDATLSVVSIRYPLMSPFNYGTNANSMGILGGAVIPLPHSQLDGGNALGISPPSLLYSGLWDVASKNCLMYWCDDEDNNALKAKLTGKTTYTELYYEHIMDRRRQGAKTYAKTYHVKMDLFTGISSDGRLCYQDFHERYRDWFADAARPWGSRGHWANASSVSSRIKNKGFIFNTSMLDTEITDEAARLAAYLGEEKILVRTRFEDGAIGTHPPDPSTVTLPAEYLTGLDLLRNMDVDVSIYTLMAAWNKDLTSPYDPDAFSGFGDLKPMMLHALSGSPHLTALSEYIWDYTHASTDNVIAELLQGYYDLHTGELPSGTYFDVDTVYTDVTVGLAQEDLAADTGWTFALHRAGIGTTTAALRAARRAEVSESITSAEVVDSATVHILDLVGIWKPWHTHEGGNDVRSQSYVAGELIRTAKLDGIAVAEGNEPYIYATIQAITKDWLSTGIATASDVSAGHALVDPDPSLGTFGPLWSWVKKLVDLGTGDALPYFQGKRVRTFGDDFTYTINASDFVGSFEEARIAALCGPYPTQAAVWQAQNGDLGILIAHCYTTGMSSPVLAPTPGPRTVPVTLVAEAYGYTDVEPKRIIRDGVTIATWVPDEDFVLDVIVEENTLTLLEVRDLPGDTSIDDEVINGTLDVTDEASFFTGFDLTLSVAAGPITLTFRSSVTHVVFHTEVFNTGGHVILKTLKAPVPLGESIQISGGGATATFNGSIFWEM